MRLVIDMQGAQSSGSRHRGIGRYTLALAKELIRQRGDHDVTLALNGSLVESIPSICAQFEDLLGKDRIRIWGGIAPVNAMDPSCDGLRIIAERVREAFLKSLKPDVVLVTSLFEGVDDAVTSIGVLPTGVCTAVILYDLIPWIHRNLYLTDSTVMRWYLSKLDHLRRADLLLTISDSSRQEALDYIGVAPSDVVTISTACDSQFRPIGIDSASLRYLNRRYGLSRPYAMYTGGIDHRKNIDRLIRAYAMLPKRTRERHQLAIVCAVDGVQREELKDRVRAAGLDTDEVIITGFVSEQDLVLLYNASRLFVFPSWHEGFGLPALEAMACGRAVIGANTSSVPEVVGSVNALFDPFDEMAISRKMHEGLENESFRAGLERHSLAQAAEFSWSKTAQLAWGALDNLVRRSTSQGVTSAGRGSARRPRLAYFSPLPPAKSGISDYSAELLPELTRHYDIDVITAQDCVSEPWVQANCAVRDIRWFQQNAGQFDRILYHFGNSHFHSHMYELLPKYPGVIVLHDFFLSGLINFMDAAGISKHFFPRALLRSHGWDAVRKYYGCKDVWNEILSVYPCNLGVLQDALGVIVHSQHARDLMDAWYGPETSSESAHVPLPRAPVVDVKREEARRILGIPQEDLVVCSFGLVGPTKLSHRLLSSWIRSPLAGDSKCHLFFVGENDSGEYGAELVRTIRSCATSGRVEITGWTDADMYRRWLAAGDVGVQLRASSRGETSAAVLDCMNFGLATVVNRNGAMAELPQDVLLMLPDDFLEEQLVDALVGMWREIGRRRTLGLRARDLVRRERQPRQCAERYAEAIERFYHRENAGLLALGRCLRRSSETLSQKDGAKVLTAIAESFPPRPRRKQLLLDVSRLVAQTSVSASDEMIREFVGKLLSTEPPGWNVAPIYACAENAQYRHARRYACEVLGIEGEWIKDDVVEAWQGDVFVCLAADAELVQRQVEQLQEWNSRGVKVAFMFADEHLDGVGCTESERWHRLMKLVSRFDEVVCTSRFVADRLCRSLSVYGVRKDPSLIVKVTREGVTSEGPVEASSVMGDPTRRVADNLGTGDRDEEPGAVFPTSARELLAVIADKSAYRRWRQDGVLRYFGGDYRLRSQVGERVGNEMRTSGRAGFLVYGPYLELDRGRYNIRIAGTISRRSGSEWVDIACHGGMHSLARMEIVSECDGGWRQTGQFELSSHASDIEFRCWVEEGTRLSIEMIEIEPSSIELGGDAATEEERLAAEVQVA